MGIISRDQGFKKINESSHIVAKAKFVEKAQELQELHNMRNVCVADVLAQAGFVGKQSAAGAYTEWKSGGRESDIKTKNELWADNLTGVGGAGGYSLAQHLQIDAGDLPRRAYSPPAPPKPATQPPAEVVGNWAYIRAWLTSSSTPSGTLSAGRNLPGWVVDQARSAGLVYSDSKKRAVFVREGGGVFVRATNPADPGYEKYGKLTFGHGGHPFVVQGDGRLLIAEAPLDALSLLSLNPGSTVLATGGDFSVDKLASNIEHAYVVSLGFDSDEKGDLMRERVRVGLPQFASKFIDHRPPAGFKDWNQTLSISSARS